MADVIANDRGYWGGILREPGDRFAIPDDVMKDKKLRPSWVRLAAFGGKGDHDGDGATGGAAPAVEPEKPKRGKGKGKAETVAAPAAEPFSDAPEPIRVENEANKIIGATEPDWIAPQPVTE